jgi:hypothetical protein
MSAEGAAAPRGTVFDRAVVFPMRVQGLTTATFTPAAQSGAKVAVAKAANVHRAQVGISNVRNVTSSERRLANPFATAGVAGVRFDCRIDVHGEQAASQVGGTLRAVRAASGGDFARLVRREMVIAVTAAGGDATSVGLATTSIVAAPSTAVRKPAPLEAPSFSVPLVVAAVGCACVLVFVLGAACMWQEGKRRARKMQVPIPNDQLHRELRRTEAELRFRESLANTNPSLHYDVVVEEVPPIPHLEQAHERFVRNLPADCTPDETRKRCVFHSCPDATRLLIVAHGMRPSHCNMCRGNAQPRDHDSGWFGNHTKGVYVSKHADYTFKYQTLQQVSPVVGDRGAVIMLEIVTGKVQHFGQRRDGALPTPDFHCHESPNHLEFFVWDTETMAEPPRHSHRAVPRFVIHWQAALNQRGGIADDGAGAGANGIGMVQNPQAELPANMVAHENAAVHSGLHIVLI